MSEPQEQGPAQSRSGVGQHFDPEDIAAARGIDPDNEAAVRRIAQQVEEQGEDAAVGEALSRERIDANEVGKSQTTGFPSIEH